MTFTDYAIDVSLIAVVLLQIRGRRLTARTLLFPLVLVGVVATGYLHGIPTSGNDLVLIIGCAGVGAVLGTLSAAFTSVKCDARGIPVAKAGALGAGMSVLGVGFRQGLA